MRTSQVQQKSKCEKAGLMWKFQTSPNIRAGSIITPNHSKGDFNQPDLLPFVPLKAQRWHTITKGYKKQCGTSENFKTHSLVNASFKENHSFVSLFPFDLDIYHFIRIIMSDVKRYFWNVVFWLIWNLIQFSYIPVSPQNCLSELRSLGFEVSLNASAKSQFWETFVRKILPLLWHFRLSFEKLDCWYETDL